MPSLGTGWSLSLYPDAAEAGGSFRYSTAPLRHAVGGDLERSKREASLRAGRMVRRYCAANRLNRLATLTYRGVGCHDPYELRRDVAEFFRSLRDMLGGDPIPYVWVPEWHKTDHGLHVHFAVGRYVPRNLIERAWGRGFVHIKLLGDLGVGSTALHEARTSARYLSKYVRKSFDHRRVPGLHRYEVAQGFQPRAIRLMGRTVEDVLRQASEVMGAGPELLWSSDETLDWQGPPAVWALWT